MSLGKLAAAWVLGYGAVLSAQIVPGWFVLELAESPTERVRGSARIRNSQSNVRRVLAARFGARMSVRDSTEVVMNSLIVQSPAGEAELAAVPGVRRVWPVYEIHPNLDRAIKLLQIDKAWEAVGGPERAGAGVKIGIVDSGLDLRHPAFQATTMTAPEGFPRATNESIRSSLNGKVIVYRTYDEMLGFAESADDNAGHGTAVAMVAAGSRVKSPQAEIQGAAPGAWLGVYKIFVGPDGESSNSAAATKAIDDAVADGMDVLNLSFGFLPQARTGLDPLLPAVERAAALGVMVVKANGNSGPVRLSGAMPYTGPFGMAVGASRTDRVFGTGIRVNQGETLYGIPGDTAPAMGSVSGPLRGVRGLDTTELACDRLPVGSLAGTVALVLRGTCTFEQKANVVQAAGAVAVVIYTHAASPDPSGMLMGAATLPSIMISNRDGLKVKTILEERPDSSVDLSFDNTLSIPVDAGVVSTFSSRGPGVDGSIQPDLLAIGEGVLTAAQNANRNGDVYDPSGFALIDGTSFSAPLVAGSYAVLKAGRPGLRLAQYRSLLVNTAQPFPAEPARPAPVQVGGAGRMDLHAALQGRLAMDPPTISFGFGGQRVDARRSVRVQNVGTGLGTWKVEVDSADDTKVTVEPSEFSLGAGDTVDLNVRFSGDLQLGEYQGFLLLRRFDAPESERPERIPYWYGVPTGRPASIALIPTPPASVEANSSVELTALITDSIGAGTPSETVRVTVLEGSASFSGAASEERAYPGYWSIRLRMGSGSGQTNRFRVESGDAVREFTIRIR